MDSAAKVGKIYGAISGMMADIEAIGKDRTNKAQGFKYRGIDDVYCSLHDILAKHKIFTVPEVLEQSREERGAKSGGLNIYSILKIKFTFYADDGSSVSAVMIGEAMDSGDKASNKAQAVAHKYCLLQVFAIPTEDEKDPDGQSPKAGPATPPRQPATTKQQPAKKPNHLRPVPTKPLCKVCGAPMLPPRAGPNYYCPNWDDPTKKKHTVFKQEELQNYLKAQAEGQK